MRVFLDQWQNTEGQWHTSIELEFLVGSPVSIGCYPGSTKRDSVKQARIAVKSLKDALRHCEVRHV